MFKQCPCCGKVGETEQEFIQDVTCIGMARYSRKKITLYNHDLDTCGTTLSVEDENKQEGEAWR